MTVKRGISTMHDCLAGYKSLLVLIWVICITCSWHHLQILRPSQAATDKKSEIAFAKACHNIDEEKTLPV